MKALILAAGYGTRLYPLTKNQAKPLLPVGDMPMVERIVRKIEQVPEVDEICLVINEKFAGNFEKWTANLQTDKKITLFNDGSTGDDDKLGAIGDMKFVIDRAGISDDLLVVAGDNLFDFSLVPFAGFFRQNGTCIGLYRVEPFELVKKYSIADIDEKSVVLNLEEKPENPSTNLIAMCIYCFAKETLALFSEYIDAGRNPDAPGYYISWLVHRMRVYGFEFKGRWFDIGDYESYNAANKVFAGR